MGFGDRANNSRKDCSLLDLDDNANPLKDNICRVRSPRSHRYKNSRLRVTDSWAFLRAAGNTLGPGVKSRDAGPARIHGSQPKRGENITCGQTWKTKSGCAQ